MTSLQVLHLNTYGGIGGAFIAADRLHQGLLRAGIPSVLAYRHRSNYGDAYLPYPEYYQLGHTHGQNLERLVSAFCQHIGLNDIGNFLTFFLSRNPFFQQTSVLNLHNLHSDYFSYLALPRLAALKPTVWTLHDMWSFTGHCAYSYECTRWQTGCGRCPHPDVQPAIKRDATAWEWRLKHWAYRHSQIHLVAISQWMLGQIRQSMLSHFPVHYIPNGIDTDIYQPLDPERCRAFLGLPPRKHVLFFSVQLFGDLRKGGDLLRDALQRLPDSLKSETVLLTIGQAGYNLVKEIGMPHYHLGYLSQDRFKAMAYSAADLFIFPTRADNLPLVLQESMACGTPMVSFNIGGVPELVRPGVTGFLAAPENVQEMRDGIVRLLEDVSQRMTMRQHCRQIAVAEYSLTRQTQQYIELYRRLQTAS